MLHSLLDTDSPIQKGLIRTTELKNTHLLSDHAVLLVVGIVGVPKLACTEGAKRKCVHGWEGRANSDTLQWRLNVWVYYVAKDDYIARRTLSSDLPSGLNSNSKNS